MSGGWGVAVDTWAQEVAEMVMGMKKPLSSHPGDLGRPKGAVLRTTLYGKARVINAVQACLAAIHWQDTLINDIAEGGCLVTDGGRDRKKIRFHAMREHAGLVFQSA